MINNISWGSYVIAISVLLSVYYLVLLLLYYRPEIQQLFRGSIRVSKAFSTNNLDQQIADSDPALYPVVHLLMGELQQLIEGSAKENLPKDELLYTLKIRLSGYQNLTGTAFQPAINKFLKEECIKQCSVRLAEEELSALWNGR